MPTVLASSWEVKEPSAHKPDHRRDVLNHSSSNDYWGQDGLRFDDVLDSLNPLHHLPVISTIYRQMTGDELSDGSRILGGSLYGGPIGMVASLINTIVDHETGRDIGEHMVAMLGGSDDTPASNHGAINVAQAERVVEPSDVLPWHSTTAHPTPAVTVQDLPQPSALPWQEAYRASYEPPSPPASLPVVDMDV